MFFGFLVSLQMRFLGFVGGRYQHSPRRGGCSRRDVAILVLDLEVLMLWITIQTAIIAVLEVEFAFGC